MKKLSKKELKGIMAGTEICLECASEYYQCIVNGRCSCVPFGMSCS